MLDRLTEAETEVFEAIRDEKYDNFALVRSHLDGEDVAVIATVNDNDNDVIITPLAVLVTDQIMNRLTDPSTEGEDESGWCTGYLVRAFGEIEHDDRKCPIHYLDTGYTVDAENEQYEHDRRVPCEDDPCEHGE